MDTELSERQLTILNTIIQIYLETGEPVGSRTISKCSDLDLSSTTIRNEMADLEDSGYIIQPYTSAGRIPSDKGYRLYVDMLMQNNEQKLASYEAQMLKASNKTEDLLKDAVDVLADCTNYVTMISTPVSHTIRSVQVSVIDEQALIVVAIFDGDAAKNKVVDILDPISDKDVRTLNTLFRTMFAGMIVTDATSDFIADLKAQSGLSGHTVDSIFDAVTDMVCANDDMQIYTSGATNIFKYPELSDQKNAQKILSAFDEKRVFYSLAAQTLSDDGSTDIQVCVGSEAFAGSMKDCSILTAVYDLGDGRKGAIGIVGPKRMDYERALISMKELQKELKNRSNI